MKNNIKKKTIILIICWLIVLTIIPIIVLNKEKSDSENGSYVSSNFDILNYDVILDVSKNNKVDVTENITVNIPDDDNKGIYKEIPLWQHYYDKDLKEKTKLVEITNLRAIGEKFDKKEYSNRVGIEIGSKRTNLDDLKHTYTIKYRYNMGKDNNNNYDEFIFNIFDKYDETKIKDLSLTINLPKEISKENIMFLDKNKDITDKIDYSITNNTIKAKLNNYELDNSLTVNLTLPNNYFIGTTSNYGNTSLIICISIIIVTIISFIIWKKYGKDLEKRSTTVEFYPPDDLDPAELGYIYGNRDIKELTTALIINLASKGFIDIEQLKNKKVKITNIGKDKDTSNLTINEHIVYEELFKNSDENLLYDDASFNVTFDKVEECLTQIIDKKVNDLGSKKKVSIVFLILFISLVAWTCSYLFIKDLDPKYNILYLISFISIFLLGLFSIIMTRKTSYGEIIIAKILGFKDYLETVQKDELNALVEKDPKYFYNIMPYTYVLHISNKWIKEFEQSNLTNIKFLNNIDNTNFFMVL